MPPQSFDSPGSVLSSTSCPSLASNVSSSSMTSQMRQPPSSSSTKNPKTLVRRQSSLETASHVTAGGFLAATVVLFSVYFPFWLAPWAASETYHYAFFEYQEDIHHFDNHWWTFGTDYLLAISMGLLISTISTQHAPTKTHAWRSRGLLACYLVSVTAGGLAHQFFLTIEQRNSFYFRFLWTICVGTVTAASGYMGSIGSQLARIDKLRTIPVIPETVWTAFGIAATAVVVVGGFSHQRPACDIFIAGITQFPSTFYIMAILYAGLPVTGPSRWARLCGVLGFILNAPLLPLYPLLVQYTDWSLAAVNTLLHIWLLIAWSMQGWSLRQVGLALAAANGPPERAVPLKRSQ